MVVVVFSSEIHNEIWLVVSRRDRQVCGAAWRRFLAVLVFLHRSFQLSQHRPRAAVSIHYSLVLFPPQAFLQTALQLVLRTLLTRLVAQILVLRVALRSLHYFHQTVLSLHLAVAQTAVDPVLGRKIAALALALAPAPVIADLLVAPRDRD